MSRLEDARRRFRSAVSRLDEASQRRKNADRAEGEIPKLSEELTEVRAAQESLERTTAAVASRLDGAIDRLRRMLDE